MKTSAVLAVMLTALVQAGARGDSSPPLPGREQWNGRALIARGRLGAAYIEPTLYRRPDIARGFFVAIWIRNLVDRPIGISGTDEPRFLHPNQWTRSDAPARGAINERTLTPKKLDAAGRKELLGRWSRQRLIVLGPGGSLETHVLFDGSSPADVDAAVGRYLILALDGQALVTDGKDCESLEAKAGGMTAADLVLRSPIAWKDLPTPAKK